MRVLPDAATRALYHAAPPSTWKIYTNLSFVKYRPVDLPAALLTTFQENCVNIDLIFIEPTVGGWTPESLTAAMDYACHCLDDAATHACNVTLISPCKSDVQ